MKKLQERRIKQILKDINKNSQNKEKYESKWHRIIHFLHNSTGLKIAKVAKAGSQAKHTNLLKSDLDVIFCTSPESDIKVIFNKIYKTATSNFSGSASVELSAHAVRFFFTNPQLRIDLVYLNTKEFDQQHKEDKNLGRIPQYKRDAIRLVKYALSKAGIGIIKGYEIETKCSNSNCTSLIPCINDTINYFNGRLNKIGYKIDDAIKFLF